LVHKKVGLERDEEAELFVKLLRQLSTNSPSTNDHGQTHLRSAVDQFVQSLTFVTLEELLERAGLPETEQPDGIVKSLAAQALVDQLGGLGRSCIESPVEADSLSRRFDYSELCLDLALASFGLPHTSHSRLSVWRGKESWRTAEARLITAIFGTNAIDFGLSDAVEVAGIAEPTGEIESWAGKQSRRALLYALRFPLSDPRIMRQAFAENWGSSDALDFIQYAVWSWVAGQPLFPEPDEEDGWLDGEDEF
jgi:hypothetical protein